MDVASDIRTETVTLNMGPQHPSTHGVLRVILEMEGEVITKATPVLGYLHRGIEKMAEDKTYQQIVIGKLEAFSEPGTPSLPAIRIPFFVPADAEEEQIKSTALGSAKVQAALAGQEPKRIIVIKSRLVNIIV